ncbi:hypothetical protein [Bacillus thermotolerans]|uniref:Uncharacterized protein n=1 Tax=Bacillus thermotolerans TaxID=1221996 RepID=A0A0F5I023_BACTR|nr:hypothetical protein [Bacillus thermotolerans]KKB38878.1 hypothetical protein QY97_01121 [Bacillus thermotolerans]KKB42455.1 hypothetical protein QY95_00304 [Bacillus thermotolerans]
MAAAEEDCDLFGVQASGMIIVFGDRDIRNILIGVPISALLQALSINITR